MKQHYWQPKLLTVCWHIILSNKKHFSESSHCVTFEPWWTLDNYSACSADIFKSRSHFRPFTSETDLQTLDISGITNNIMQPVRVTSTFDDIRCRTWTGQSCSQDVLHGIVSVHINVRSFSFVRGIIQRYKTAEKQTKTRASPKGISRSYKGQPRSPGSPFLPPLEQGWQRGRATKAGLRLLIHIKFWLFC